MTTWQHMLDAMERSLDHFEAALGAESISPDPHWPVADPPVEPVPAELLARAAELLARNNRISAQIRTRLEDRPARPRRRDGFNRASSGVSMIDTSA